MFFLIETDQKTTVKGSVLSKNEAVWIKKWAKKIVRFKASTFIRGTYGRIKQKSHEGNGLRFRWKLKSNFVYVYLTNLHIVARGAALGQFETVESLTFWENKNQTWQNIFNGKTKSRWVIVKAREIPLDIVLIYEKGIDVEWMSERFKSILAQELNPQVSLSYIKKKRIYFTYQNIIFVFSDRCEY